MKFLRHPKIQIMTQKKILLTEDQSDARIQVDHRCGSRKYGPDVDRI